MSSAFKKLAQPLQRVLYAANWKELRPIQVDAIHEIFDSDNDLIISASTASGKTEAAFLPLLSQVIDERDEGIQILYVAPLKALINDQTRRLESLLNHTDLPVHRWHGDVSGDRKKKVRTKPEGVLLITPESLESCFINYGRFLDRMFRNLKFIVIDELHAFVSDVRGVHLSSLLARLEQITPKRPRRLGLSATLGDFSQPSRFLFRQHPEKVRVIEDEDGARRLRIGLRAYPNPIRQEKSGEDREDTLEQQSKRTETSALAQELARVFRLETNLIFTNSKQLAELLTEEISEIKRRECWQKNPFLIHHGSLSKESREYTEARLKNGEPISVFCTSTLEMGIDIGDVSTVGQLSPPWSVASLKQRIGRSGRSEGQAAVLRMYSLDKTLSKDSPVREQLRPQLVRSIALIELMLGKWVEPSPDPCWQLSTLVQQTLSILRQRGGAQASEIFTLLCRNGVFESVSSETFRGVLRSLGQNEVIEQMSDGLLILTPKGEHITHDRDFYAAFMGSDDFTIRCQGYTIGTLPSNCLPQVGENFILSGKKWKVVQIETAAKVVEVMKTKAKKEPFFGSDFGETHPRVAQKMREVLCSQADYRYLHQDAREELEKARNAFKISGLAESAFIQEDNSITFFPWTGSRAMTTFRLAAKMGNISCAKFENCLVYQLSQIKHLREHFSYILENRFEAIELARQVPSRHLEKYDRYLDDDLLDQINSQRIIDLKTVKETIKSL